MKRILLYLLLSFLTTFNVNAAVTWQYNCDDNTQQPTVGTIVSATTDNATVNSKDTQLGNTDAKKIVIPTAEIDISQCEIRFWFRPDFDPGAGGTLFEFIMGKYTQFFPAIVGDWSLMVGVDTSDGYIQFYPTSSKSIQWEIPAGAFNTLDGLEWILQADNANPIGSTGKYATLSIDGVACVEIGTGADSGWTAETNATNPQILGTPAVSAGYGNRTKYIDDIVIYDAPQVVNPLVLYETDKTIYAKRLDDTQDVELDGTYAVTLPTGIEARVFNFDTDADVLVDGNVWNQLSAETIFDGFWDGTLLNVPKTFFEIGVEVRKLNEPATTAGNVLSFGVGVIGSLTGQSGNAKLGTPIIDPDTQIPLPALGRRYPISGTTGRSWVGGNTGSALVQLITKLIAENECMVGIMDYANDGASLFAINEAGTTFSNWETGWLYTDYVISVAAIGGKLHFTSWYQGESEAATIYTNYEAGEQDLFTRFRTLAQTPDGTELPIINTLLARWKLTITDEAWSFVNKAKLNNYNNGINDYIISPIDLPMETQFYHISDIGRIYLADRYFDAIKVIMGQQSTYRGPRSVHWEQETPATIRVLIELEHGDGLLPTTGIDSYEVNIGTLVTPNWVASTGVVFDSENVVLTFTTGTAVDVRCMYGRFENLAPTANILTNNLGSTTFPTSQYLPILQDSSIPELSYIPIITIITPTTDPTYDTSSSTINIAGTSSISSGSIVSVTWVNDQGGSGTATLSGSGPYTWLQNNISLVEGDNVVTFTATSGLSETNTDTLTVTYTKPEITGGSGGWGGSPWGS